MCLLRLRSVNRIFAKARIGYSRAIVGVGSGIAELFWNEGVATMGHRCGTMRKALDSARGCGLE